MITSPVVVKRKFKIPYLIVVVALVFCLPLGIFLMKRRMDADRSVIFQGSTTLPITIGAWFLLGLSALFIILALTSQDVTVLLVVAMLFCVPGLCANGYALYLKKTRVLYRRYLELIVNQEMTDLVIIAAHANVTLPKLIRGLAAMIEHGNLPGASLDIRMGTITLHHDPATAGMVKEKTYAKQCPNCCANGKVVPGQNNVCEYCGTFLGS